MKGFIGLTKRNMLVYFKDRQAVIFSLLTSIIVFTLYMLFLRNMYVDMLNNSLEELKDFIEGTDVEGFINGFLLVGIMGSALITVPYNCLSTLVGDKERKIDYDILATPIRRGMIILSYFVAAALSTCIMTTLIMSVGLVTISFLGNLYMSAAMVLRCFGVVILGSISSTAFFIIFMMFFKSTSASGAFFGILSAASGFVIGAYIPVSEFSGTVQTVCNFFPASHVTVMLRKVILTGVVDHMSDTLNGLDNGQLQKGLSEGYGLYANMFDRNLTMSQNLIYVFAALAVCLAVMVMVYLKTNKRNWEEEK